MGIMEVSAIVLAAGQSRRMGQSKMDLAWGETTVIGQVVKTLAEAGMNDIILVTGSIPLSPLSPPTNASLRFTPNVSPEQADMLGSLQSGIRYLLTDKDDFKNNGVLVALGDMPTITFEIVRSVIEAKLTSNKKIIVPSYKMRRGHPWLVDVSLLAELLELVHPFTLRDFLNKHADEIEYVLINDSGILSDIDTPEDYQRLKPEG